MFFLFDVCNNIITMQVLYFGGILLDIFFTAIPIFLIIKIIISFSKGIVQSKYDDQLKDLKKIGNKLLFAIIIFLIPWIVQVFFNILSDVYPESKSEYMVCLNNVNEIHKGNLTFADFEQIEYAKININKNFSGGGSNSKPSGGSIEERTASNLVNTALAEEGKNDRTKYEFGHNYSSYGGWCASFVSWNLKQTKYKDGSLFDYINSTGILEAPGKNSHSSSPFYIAYNFRKVPGLREEKSMNRGGNYRPKKGDIIFFCWPNKSHSDGNKYDHIGIVVSCDGNNVNTIEGNSTGGKVNRKSYSIDSSSIYSYGVWY